MSFQCISQQFRSLRKNGIQFLGGGVRERKQFSHIGTGSKVTKVELKRALSFVYGAWVVHMLNTNFTPQTILVISNCTVRSPSGRCK